MFGLPGKAAEILLGARLQPAATTVQNAHHGAHQHQASVANNTAAAYASQLQAQVHALRQHNHQQLPVHKHVEEEDNADLNEAAEEEVSMSRSV